MADVNVADLVSRLRARAEQQREGRGDMLYRGEADPELEEAAADIERLYAIIGVLQEDINRLSNEYICTCGLRVEPHRCRTREGEF